MTHADIAHRCVRQRPALIFQSQFSRLHRLFVHSAHSVSLMPVFPHLPLGQRIPPTPHAVSCSLPKMRDVRGYEEKDPETMRQLTSGYPRFVVHPFARQLVAHFTATTPELANRTLWLTSSAKMAAALATHLGGGASGVELFTRDGISGVSHPTSTELYG